MSGYRGFSWLIARSANLIWHMFGSRVLFGRFGKRKQVLINKPWSDSYWTFGWGKRDGSRA